jgi:nitroimidazol reductase NimA-like FMN-containing flavoprotein (pyridoxamine 5'-phosphate oxidase superfamily)
MRRDDIGDIPRHECWDLLRTVSVGRLALSVSALPAILPVQYYLEGDELAACLGHYTVPLVAVDDVVVAFAADHIGPGDRAGWSVQVQGLASIPKHLSVPVDCGQPTAGQIIRIAPVNITGHRIQLCPFVSSHGGTIH